MKTCPILLLVDGHNLLCRAWFGFPTRIKTRRGDDLTAIFGFFALLRSGTTEIAEPTEIIVCFDGEYSMQTRRQELDGYKVGRDEGDLGYLRYLDPVKTALNLLGISWFEEPSIEADDVIASLSHCSTGRRTLIMSTDKDYYQLLTDTTFVLNTAKPVGQRVITPVLISQRYGVNPQQWCDFRALTGDPSDNIPGIRGIGNKRAARILQNVAQLDDLLHLPASRLATLSLADTDLDVALRYRDLMKLRIDILTPDIVRGIASSKVPLARDVVASLQLW